MTGPIIMAHPVETNESKLYECTYKGRVQVYTFGVWYAKAKGITAPPLDVESIETSLKFSTSVFSERFCDFFWEFYDFSYCIKWVHK